jgi:FkbM family methyltransferase
VVELMGVHDEVMPSLFDMLIANGVEPTGFLNQRLGDRGDVFGRFTSYGDRVNYCPLTSPDEWDALLAEVRDFDLLVMNTYSQFGHAKFAKATGLPAIGVVHNPKLVLSRRACVFGIQSGRVTPVTLAPHVTSWMMAEAPELFSHAATLGTWMWEMPEVRKSEPPKRRRIAVPGGVSFGKRDFPLVVDTLPGLIDRFGADRFEIAVVGGGSDRAKLEDLVAERGLGDVFDFAPLDPATGAVPSHEYYPRVAGSTLLLPLLPERLASYRVSKITAAVSSSIGFTVPSIIDRWTSTVYDLPGVTYPLGSLADGLARAVEMSDDELEAIRQRLARRRATMIERATAEMGEALRVVGTAPPRRTTDQRGGKILDAAATEAREISAPVEVDREDREAFLAFAQLILPHSYSQRLQDLWALWESGFSTDGYFVEFGALNGRDFSNSYLAEQLGWTGVVAEPHPNYEKHIRAHRNCTISTKCVFDKTGELVEFHAVQGRPALSTVGGFGTDDSRSQLREEFVTHQVETITLADLLEEAHAPEVVDYLSIDTEGSELVILRAYDFAARPIRLITVEHNDAHRDELYDFLTSQGYRRKWPDLSGHDDWYVHESAFPDWSAERLPRLLETAFRVEPFKNNYPVRERLVDDFRTSNAPPTEILGVAEPALPVAAGEATRALEASYRFNTSFMPLVAQRTGISNELLNQRVRTTFMSLCAKLKPTVTLEIGAFEASFSREMKKRLPDARVVAYEANPSTDEHEQVSVPAVRIDDEFPDHEKERFVAWIDVKGAAEEVLKGAERVLSRTMALYIGVETRPILAGQWLDTDVAKFLLERGFVLIGRDMLEPHQFNLVFVHRSVVKRPAVARHAARIYRPVRRAPKAPQPSPNVLRRAAGRISRAVRRRTPQG